MIAGALHGGPTVSRMADCILDEALLYCRRTLDELGKNPETDALRGRLAVLERAAWSLSVLPARADQVLRVAKLVLDLRDDVAVHGSRDSAVQLVTARDLAS